MYLLQVLTPFFKLLLLFLFLSKLIFKSLLLGLLDLLLYLLSVHVWFKGIFRKLILRNSVLFVFDIKSYMVPLDLLSILSRIMTLKELVELFNNSFRIQFFDFFPPFDEFLVLFGNLFDATLSITLALVGCIRIDFNLFITRMLSF